MKFCIAVGEKTSPQTPLLLAGDFITCMEQAKDIGYDAIEIHTPDPQKLNARELNAACGRLNMSVATLGTGMIYGRYGLHLMDENPENRSRIVELVKRYVDVASEIGSKVTIGSIKGNVPDGASRAQCLQILGDNLKRISEYAVKRNVIVLLEATNHFENNVLNTGKDLFEIIEKYDLQNFQALMDTFHINIEETSVQTCLRDAGRYLGHIHFGDNTRTYPGSGAFRYDLFCQSIKDIHYDGVLSVECFPVPDGRTAAVKTMEFFRKYFGEEHSK